MIPIEFVLVQNPSLSPYAIMSNRELNGRHLLDIELPQVPEIGSVIEVTGKPYRVMEHRWKMNHEGGEWKATVCVLVMEGE